MNPIPDSKELINPISYTISLLNGKWKLKIILKLQEGAQRFKELERGLRGITPRMLIRELKDLEEKGIVARTVYQEIPSRVEYSLKEEASSLLKLISAMEEWGTKHLEKNRANPILQSETLPATPHSI